MAVFLVSPNSNLLWNFKKVFKELILRSPIPLPLPLLVPLQKLSAMRLAFWQTAVNCTAWERRCGCVEQEGFTSDRPHCCKHGMLAGQICRLFVSFLCYSNSMFLHLHTSHLSFGNVCICVAVQSLWSFRHVNMLPYSQSRDVKKWR